LFAWRLFSKAKQHTLPNAIILGVAADGATGKDGLLQQDATIPIAAASVAPLLVGRVYCLGCSTIAVISGLSISV